MTAPYAVTEAGVASVVVLDPRGEAVIDPTARIRRVAGGATWSEGPVYVAALDEVWWSDIPGDRVLAWHRADGTVRVAHADAEFPNGRTLDVDGGLVQCSHGRRRVERLAVDGTTTPVTDRHPAGVRLNSPNDLVVAADGAVWFTDPPYGILQPREGHPGELEYADCWVFRVARGTTTAVPVAIDIERPNGLAFSPDESILYVTDTSQALDHGHSHWIRAYDVHDGVRLKNGRIFVAIQDGVPDGIRVDVHGNVWSSAADGVHVYAEDGTEIARIGVPEAVANLCFGGPDGQDLYVAATTGLYAVRTSTGDAAHRR